MTRFRLVAVDLDGTLLRSDGSVSASTAAVIAELSRSGVRVVPVTARFLDELRIVADQAGLTDLAAVSSGAEIHDLATGSTVTSWTMPPETVTDIFDDLRAAVPTISLGWVDALGAHADAEFPVTPFVRRLEPGAPAAPELPVLKGFAFDTAAEGTPRDLGGLLAGRATIGFGDARFFDFTTPGVSKLDALRSICDLHGIAREEVIAFGDSPNDLPMIRWAGHGVAVANAHRDVVAGADATARSCDEDGVARYLEALLDVEVS